MSSLLELRSKLFGWLGRSVRAKLLITLLALSLIPLVGLGLAAEHFAAAALRDRTTAQLEAVATLQQQRVTTLFREYGHAVHSVAAHPETHERLAKLEAAPPEEKQRLVAALEAHMKVTVDGLPAIENMQVLDAKGTIIADTLPPGVTQKGHDKSKDPYYTGALAKPGEVFIKPIYKSSLGIPASAVSITVKDANGKLLGVVVMRVTTAEIDRILLDRNGMGNTGESYLVVGQLVVSAREVKSGKLMATKSRFTEDNVLKQVVETEGSSLGLEKQTGSAVYVNYRGARVIGHYSFVPELNSALLSEVEEDEAIGSLAPPERD